MGGSCHKNENRDLLVVGNYCENSCFPEHGGCASAIAEKVDVRCELRPEFPEKSIPNAMRTINDFIEKATAKGREVFLYTPDMFNDYYFGAILSRLPKRNGGTYIAVNGCVRTFLDKVNWQFLYDRGIREVWLGVESGSQEMRALYNKPPFTNEEVEKITVSGRHHGINICWFLVDGDSDTDKTRLKTYSLLKQAQPYKFHFSEAVSR